MALPAMACRRAFAGVRIGFHPAVLAANPATAAAVPIRRALPAAAAAPGSRELLPASVDGGPAAPGAGVRRVPLAERRHPVRRRAQRVARPVHAHPAAAAVVRRNLAAGGLAGRPDDNRQLLA